jgi:protein-tyrosine kinase
MSRIEEALRRSSPRVGNDPADAWADGGPLERYPVESRTATPDSSREIEPAKLPSHRPGIVIAPRTGPRALRPLDPEVEGRLLLSAAVPPAAVEQYRRLAMTLHQGQHDRQLKTLLISSAVPLEGKTLTAINLALTLSESYGRRVLLIDADLRRPSIHQVLDLPNVTGLGDALRGGKGPLSYVAVSDTLTVLTAGKQDSDPMAGFASGRMKQIIEEAEARFDWVIIDTPPAAVCPDAPLLAPLTDGVLLVVRAGSTASALVKRTAGEFAPDEILGVILNNADPNTLPKSEYYDTYSGKGSEGSR